MQKPHAKKWDELKEIHEQIKRRSLSPLTKTDPIITAPEKEDDVIEVVNEADAEHALVMNVSCYPMATQYPTNISLMSIKIL